MKSIIIGDGEGRREYFLPDSAVDKIEREIAAASTGKRAKSQKAAESSALCNDDWQGVYYAVDDDGGSFKAAAATANDGCVPNGRHMVEITPYEFKVDGDVWKTKERAVGGCRGRGGGGDDC